MDRRALAVLLLAAGLLGVAKPAPSQAAAACDGPEDFTMVPGQGPSCRIDGLWTVLLATGEQLLTHGGDPVPVGPALAATPRPPGCVGAGEHRSELVYARPLDKVGRYDSAARELRSLVAQANGRLYEDSVVHGVAADYAFLCDRGTLVVHYAVLSSTSQGDSFASIVSGLQSLGYRDPQVKYWVLYDDQVAGQAAGQGNVHRDDRPVADNANNGGADYGISYGVFDARLLMHENAHNMGAVQLSAPHSSGGWHCNDGRDVMCYADGAPRSSYVAGSCAATRFDCGSDDYYHPAPPAGSYLATHWNIGSPLNRFLRRGPAPAPQPVPPEPTAPAPTPTPAPTGGTPTGAPAADTRAPYVRLRVASRIPASRLVRRGLPVNVRCSERCRLVVQLRTRSRPVRVLASVRRGPVRAGSSHWVVVRLTRRGRAMVSRRGLGALSLRVRAVDDAGNVRTVGRVVRLRRP